MIKQLTTQDAQQYVLDDPVRPHLDAEYRTTQGRQMWALYQDQHAAAHLASPAALAIICVAYTNAVPKNETELHWYSSAAANTAVFYTVWSYSQGAGRSIVQTVADHILNTMPNIQRWVTLSPLTELAERFHLRNGARQHSVHDTCQIFEYTHLMKKPTQ